MNYNLPIDALNWNWGDYIRSSRKITAGNYYENIFGIGLFRTQNTYPFSSIDNNVNGLSIAVPMDYPRIYRMNYSSASGYSIQYDFGLSNQTTKIGPGRASFKFIVYKNNESDWGFRGAAKKYYEIYPRLFEKRTQKDGQWIAAITQEDIPNAQDFGFMFDQSGDQHKDYDNKNGIYSLIYTEPWGWWRDFGTNSVQPGYDDLVSALNGDLSSTGYLLGKIPTSEMAQAVINSSPYDSDGKYYLGTWQAWGTEGHWFQSYPTNPSLDITFPNRYHASYEHEIKSSIDYAIQNGGYIDNWSFGKDNSWDSAVFHSGSHSAKVNFVTNSADLISTSWTGDRFAILPNTKYNFSSWIKNQSASLGYTPSISLVELDSNQGWITQHILRVDSPNSNWEQRTSSFVSSSQAAFAYVYIRIYRGSGIGWFDDVGLTANNFSENLIKNPGFESNPRGEQANYSIDGAHLDSLTIQTLWPTIENYRQEHWASANQPLAFNFTTGKLFLAQFLSHYDYIDAVSKSMHSQNKILSANSFLNSYVFYAHLLDRLGSEIYNNEADDKASYRRTLAYQKPNSNIMQWGTGGGHSSAITNQEMDNYIKHEMFYGMFPSISGGGPGVLYWKDPNLYERDRPLFKKYIPIIKTISKAGWEPIPYAVSDNSNIWLERYGYWDKGNLHYAVRNDQASSQSGNIVIDLSKLGASSLNNLQIKELTSNSSITPSISGTKAAISVSLNSGDTLVYSLSSPSNPADLNQDGIVNSVDFGILMSYWNSASRPKADLNQDGIVNSVDFGIMMSKWG